MVAGLGLTGLALGMAFKEILSNALAGVQILMYKPFKRNDTIAALTFQGTVVEVNLRYTAIESAGVRVFIPNTLLLGRTRPIGGIIECRVKNPPIALGEPFFYSFESALSHIMFNSCY